MSVTMHDVAVDWVKNHRATCSSETCGCANADTDEMVAALVARWLGLEP